MADHDPQSLLRNREQLSSLISKLKAQEQALPWLSVLENTLHELDRLVRHDHLTGILNRRASLEALSNELERSRRTGHTFAFALMSIDSLEQILEQHGSAIARTVIQVFAQTSAQKFRSLDVFGRIAANEFILIMPTTWLEPGRQALHLLRTRLAEVETSDLQAIALNFRAGLTINAPLDSADSMLTRTLKALHEARAAAEPAIILCDPPLPEFLPEK